MSAFRILPASQSEGAGVTAFLYGCCNKKIENQQVRLILYFLCPLSFIIRQLLFSNQIQIILFFLLLFSLFMFFTTLFLSIISGSPAPTPASGVSPLQYVCYAPLTTISGVLSFQFVCYTPLTPISGVSLLQFVCYAPLSPISGVLSLQFVCYAPLTPISGVSPLQFVCYTPAAPTIKVSHFVARQNVGKNIER